MNEQNYEKVYDPIAARERRAAREKLHRRKQQRRRQRLRRLVALCLAVVLTVYVVPPLCNRAEQLLYPRKYEQLVEKWAATYELDPLLVYAFIRTESGFDPQATSSVDARGLMQMTEETFLWMRSKIAPEEPLTFADLYSPNFTLNNSVLRLSYNYIFRSYNNINESTLCNIVHSHEFTAAKSYFHMSCHNTFENITFTDKVSYKRILWLIIYILRRTNLLYPAF